MDPTLLMAFDGSNFAIRNSGSFSFRDSSGDILRTADGRPTAMLLGSINAFLSLYSRFRFTHGVFTFDWGRSALRTQIRASYKAHRRGGESDFLARLELKPQFGYFDEFLDIVGVPRLRVRDVEADDLLATVAYKAHPAPTMIVSADHDLLQLVSPTVRVFRNSIGKSPEVIYDEQAVFAKYGLPPDKLAEMWAIMGDDGDGVEGLAKVGPVTATKMIKAWGSLEGAIRNDLRCKGHERQLRENLDLIKLDGSRFSDLVPDDLDLEFRPRYSTELREFFERFELNSLVLKWNQRNLF